MNSDPNQPPPLLEIENLVLEFGAGKSGLRAVDGLALARPPVKQFVWWRERLRQECHRIVDCPPRPCASRALPPGTNPGSTARSVAMSKSRLREIQAGSSVTSFRSRALR